MNAHRILPAACLALMATVAAAIAGPPARAPQAKPAKQEASKSEFLRVSRDADGQPLALQAAIVRCVREGRARRGPVVDLVATVHVAEKGYYEQLNREFAKYDVVLYELVAPEGTRVPKGGGRKSESPVSFLQNGMKRMLELEFQLDVVDYTRDNLVHADMSPEQFAASMQRRGESMLGTFLRMMGYALTQQHGQGSATDAQLLLALFDKDRAMALKRVLAEQFEQMGGSLLAINGPDGSTIITERNKVALAVLRKQIAAGKRRIAVFYGAGHMPDMQERLRDDFGLTSSGTRWLDAWRLKGS